MGEGARHPARQGSGHTSRRTCSSSWRFAAWTGDRAAIHTNECTRSTRRPVGLCYGFDMAALETDTRTHILDTAQALMARKGYTAVGLSEVLSAAEVPKGSFYYYFSSKEAFGEALMKAYFDDYLATMRRIASDSSKTGAEQLDEYWQRFSDLQTFDDCQGKCLVVKLAAEVSDLSEPMRHQLVDGTAGIIDHLERMIATGQQDGSVSAADSPQSLAHELYEAWLGASVIAKVQRTPASLERVMQQTRARLHP